LAGSAEVKETLSTNAWPARPTTTEPLRFSTVLIVSREAAVMALDVCGVGAGRASLSGSERVKNDLIWPRRSDPPATAGAEPNSGSLTRRSFSTTRRSSDDDRMIDIWLSTVGMSSTASDRIVS